MKYFCMKIRKNGKYLIYILSSNTEKGQEEIMMTLQEIAEKEDEQVWVK